MNFSELALQPHRRFNPLTREWVLVSPHRTERPWQGQVESVPPETPATYDPNCYLCPGNARAAGVKNPAYTETFVFDNDFAALKPATPADEIQEQGLLVARSEAGRCRVVCFSPRHDLAMARMSVSELRHVVDAWVREFSGQTAGRLPGVTRRRGWIRRGMRSRVRASSGGWRRARASGLSPWSVASHPRGRHAGAFGSLPRRRCGGSWCPRWGGSASASSSRATI